jgi:hypothetical protein
MGGLPQQEGGRENKPDGLFLDRNRLNLFTQHEVRLTAETQSAQRRGCLRPALCALCVSAVNTKPACFRVLPRCQRRKNGRGQRGKQAALSVQPGWPLDFADTESASVSGIECSAIRGPLRAAQRRSPLAGDPAGGAGGYGCVALRLITGEKQTAAAIRSQWLYGRVAATRRRTRKQARWSISRQKSP